MGSSWGHEHHAVASSDTRSVGPVRVDHEHQPPHPAPLVSWISYATPHGDGQEATDDSVVSTLRKNKVVQWIAAYLGVACVSFQMTEALGGIWGWPQEFQRGVTLAVAMGTLPAAVVAWYHGEKGRQATSFGETLAVGTLVVASLVVAWRLS